MRFSERGLWTPREATVRTQLLTISWVVVSKLPFIRSMLPKTKSDQMLASPCKGSGNTSVSQLQFMLLCVCSWTVADAALRMCQEWDFGMVHNVRRAKNTEEAKHWDENWWHVRTYVFASELRLRRLGLMTTNVNIGICDSCRLRKSEEARAFRRKLMRRPIALRGDTKFIPPHMLGAIVLPYVQDAPGPQVAGIRQMLHLDDRCWLYILALLTPQKHIAYNHGCET